MKRIGKYGLLILGLLFVVFAVKDSTSIYRVIPDVITAVILVLVSVGMFFDERAEKRGEILTDERDVEIEYAADHNTVKWFGRLQLGISLIAIILYATMDKNFICGLIAMFTLISWVMLNGMGIVSGLVEASRN